MKSAWFQCLICMWSFAKMKYIKSLPHCWLFLLHSVICINFFMTKETKNPQDSWMAVLSYCVTNSKLIVDNWSFLIYRE